MSQDTHADDLTTVRELESMARIYQNRGNMDKACELLELAARMMHRVNSQRRGERKEPRSSYDTGM